MKIKRLFAFLLSAILSVSVLASCGSDTEQPQEEDKGAVIEAYFGEQMPSDFDPTTFAVNSDKYQITSLLYEGLFGIDKNGKVYGVGADKWEYGVDARSGELKLVIELKDTCWSDSIPVRADDYIFAWKRLLAPSNSNPAASILYPVKNARKIKSGELTVADIGASAVSDKTLEIVFEEGFTDVEYFLRALASPVLVPLREEKVKSDDWSTKLDLLVTNGPFAIKSMSDDRLIIERSLYYNARKQRQAYDAYVKPYRIIAHFGNEAEALEAFNGKDIATKYYYLSDLSKDAYEQLGKKAEAVSDLTTYTYFFNTKNELLSDAQTRKALSAALDREEIAAVRGVLAKAATGLVPVGVKETGTKKDFRASAKDTLAASLEGAKATSTGALTLTYNADRVYEEEIAKLAKAAWEKLGFEITLEGVSGNEIASVIKSGEFDIIAADYIAFTDDAYGFVAPFALEFSGSYVDVTNPDVFFNPHFTGFESEEYNALIEKLFTADKETRAALMHEAEEMLLDAAPVAPLFFEMANHAKNKSLSKVEIDYRGNKNFTKAKLSGYKKINKAREAAEG